MKNEIWVSISIVRICPVVGSKDFVRVRQEEVFDESADSGCGDVTLWDILTFLLKMKCSNNGKKPSNRYVCHEV